MADENKDLQHKLAVFLGNLLFNGEETQKDKILLIYGVEVLLNQILKLLFIIVIGIILKMALWTLVGLLIFFAYRRCGCFGHCKTNTGCFFVTIATVIFPVIISVKLGEGIISLSILQMIILMLVGVTLIAIFLLPTKISLFKFKINSKYLMCGTLVAGFICAMYFNSTVLALLLFTLAVVSVFATLFFGKVYEQYKGYN